MRAAIVICTVCLLATGAQALMIPLDDAALTSGADEIVHGTITNVHSQWNADITEIVTTATVSVKSRPKGTGPNAFTLTVPGGTVDGITEWVEEEPTLVAGTDAIIFVNRSATRGATVHGAYQGFVPVQQGAVARGPNGKDGAVTADAYEGYLAALAAGESPTPPQPAPTPAVRALGSAPVITSVSPATASSGTWTTITITGTGFGTKASRESVANVGFSSVADFPASGGALTHFIFASGYPNFAQTENEILDWTDTRIVVTVPLGKTYEGVVAGASSGYLFVYTDAGATSANFPFRVTFSYGGYRWWDDSCRFYVNPAPPSGPVAVMGIQSAAGIWNTAAADSPFRFVYLGTTSAWVARDNQNTFCFRPASEFTDGKIAEAARWSEGGRLSEADIRFNQGYSWILGGGASGSTYNMEASALHELGHCLALKDLYGTSTGASDLGKVMFGEMGERYGNMNLKTLHADEVAGIRWIYTKDPLAVASITPNTGAPGTTVAITNLAGTYIRLNSRVALRRSGLTDIVATDVVVVSPTQITCRFILPATALTGAWDVVVTDPNRKPAILAGGFAVGAKPTVTGISPASAPRGSTLTVDVVGTYFASGAQVAIAGGTGGTTTVYATEVSVVSPSQIRCKLAIPSTAYPGPYTLSVLNPGDTAWSSKAGAFTVTAPVAGAVKAPGGVGVPTDTNGDGKADDVNGNGRRDFADITVYFGQLAWIAANEPLAPFDPNANGRIDFADVVWLFTHL